MLKHVDDVNRISEAKIMLSENTYIKEALDEKSTMYHSINDYAAISIGFSSLYGQQAQQWGERNAHASSGR